MWKIIKALFGVHEDMAAGFAKREKHVYVCGMPGSGNRIIRDYCASLGLTSVIWHGNKTERGKEPFRKDVDIYIVVPLRNPEGRLKASTASESDDVLLWQQRVKDWYRHMPVSQRRTISYERLCKEPEAHFVALCSWLGVPYKPCPFEIRKPA